MVVQRDYGVIPDRLKEVLQTIFDSSNALSVVVQDFLDVSRIEQGKMNFEFTNIDLGKLVEDVMIELRPNIEKKHLRLVLSVEPKVMVYADKGKLKQVIENLIDNALKYTPKGYIEVRLARVEHMARLTIKDTGIGIRPQTLPNLFQKFSRQEDASKANILGTGLGLYVAKELLRAQCGHIWAESEGEGQGSTFTVEVPLKM